MTDFPIPNTPTSLYPGGYQDSLSIQNRDAVNTVYLGESTAKCQQGQGLPLGPRASVPWDKERPLWASAPANTVANPLTLSVVANTGAVFSPGDIAAQILSQGLAAQIAAAIKISGVPPIDNVMGLDDSGVQNGAYNSPSINTAGYNSVGFLISNINLNAILGINLLWFAASGAFLGQDAFGNGLGFTTQATYPVRGAILQIQINGTNQFEIVTYGSYKTADHVSYLGVGNNGSPTGGTVTGVGQGGVQVWTGTVPAGATWTWQPDTPSGGVVISSRVNSTFATAAASFVGFYRSAVAFNGGIDVYDTDQSPIITSGTVLMHRLTLPPQPFEISYVAGTSPMTFRTTIVSERPY